ncbi:MAG: DNA mismatch repair endonuclease MutL [Ruminococcus sp.]|nr:DNA mismatch repair endonuclease MutL [Ruminococcus sp.]
MGKINVLDKHTAELIAAGEVVERPSSVVKELLENSIDAGADKITVEIRRGGIDFLRITDNGSGILKDDIRNAFKRNATSKISEESDLERILTLGFRGEALASISSVSKVQIITKSKEEPDGTAYVIEGGEEKSFEDAGCPDGTTFIMRELFYNVPARFKFLKKDVAEGNSVSGVIDRIALSHPEISFTFIRDDKKVLQTSGDGKLLSVIYSVYGRDFAKTLIPVNYELDGIKVHGYISKPVNGRPNRRMQNVFINGRFVKSNTVSMAMQEACKNSIMVGKFPSCVLNIEMSAEAVDVNVHPSKIEVRFINERPVFDAVYHGVKSSLLKNDTRKEVVLEQTRQLNPFELANRVIKDKPENMPGSKPIAPKISVPLKSEIPPIFSELDFNSEKKVSKVADSVSPFRAYKNILKTAGEKILPKEEKPKSSVPEQTLHTVPEQLISNNSESEKTKAELPTLRAEFGKTDGQHKISTIIDKDKNTFRYIGEAMDTYIIVETDNNKIVLIDKHAAHERIIFEKLKREKGRGSVQMLLVPVTVTLDADEYNSAIEHLDMLKEVGFDVEDFGGNSIIVRSAPSYLRDTDVEETVLEICSHIADNRKEVISEHMEWIYHNISCRSAIKAGNKSTAKELIDIAETVFSDDTIRYCPHGRPVCIELSKYEIEKQFGRA